MKYCWALNAGITRTTGSALSFGRVAGVIIPSSPNINYAWGLMEEIPLGATGEPGTPYSAASAKYQNLYSNDLHWEFGNDDEHPWKWGGEAYPLPVLYWQDEASYPELPGHLK